MPQLLFPIRELRIAGAKREHRVGQRLTVHDARVDPHQHGAVLAAFDIPGLKVLQGRFCPAGVVGRSCEPMTARASHIARSERLATSTCIVPNSANKF